jgi:hypothetical protein
MLHCICSYKDNGSRPVRYCVIVLSMSLFLNNRMKKIEGAVFSLNRYQTNVFLMSVSGFAVQITRTCSK